MSPDFLQSKRAFEGKKRFILFLKGSLASILLNAFFVDNFVSLISNDCFIYINQNLHFHQSYLQKR